MNKSKSKALFREEFLNKKKFDSTAQFNEDVRGMLPQKFEQFIDQIYQSIVDDMPVEKIGIIPSRETCRILKEHAEVGKIDGYNQHVKETEEYSKQLLR